MNKKIFIAIAASVCLTIFFGCSQRNPQQGKVEETIKNVDTILFEGGRFNLYDLQITPLGEQVNVTLRLQCFLDENVTIDAAIKVLNEQCEIVTSDGKRYKVHLLATLRPKEEYYIFTFGINIPQIDNKIRFVHNKQAILLQTK